jgi:glycosyltransferase involved in cell wall biosynthesis
MTDDIADVFGLPLKKLVTIYNPIKPSQRSRIDNDDEHRIRGDTPTILGAGRLVDEKDFSTLIRAFSRVRSERSSRLYILGDGDNRSSLIKVAENCGVKNNVYMPGFVEDPFAYMKLADVFVLSSRWEGFGNVLVEAMACGTPVISTDCPNGPAEILENGKWGQLVPVGDEEAMAEAIRTTLDGAQDSVDPTRRAEDFHVREIADKYLGLLT